MHLHPFISWTAPEREPFEPTRLPLAAAALEGWYRAYGPIGRGLQARISDYRDRAHPRPGRSTLFFQLQHRIDGGAIGHILLFKDKSALLARSNPGSQPTCDGLLPGRVQFFPEVFRTCAGGRPYPELRTLSKNTRLGICFRDRYNAPASAIFAEDDPDLFSDPQRAQTLADFTKALSTPRLFDDLPWVLQPQGEGLPAEDVASGPSDPAWVPPDALRDGWICLPFLSHDHLSKADHQVIRNFAQDLADFIKLNLTELGEKSAVVSVDINSLSQLETDSSTWLTIVISDGALSGTYRIKEQSFHIPGSQERIHFPYPTHRLNSLLMEATNGYVCTAGGSWSLHVTGRPAESAHHKMSLLDRFDTNTTEPRRSLK